MKFDRTLFIFAHMDDETILSHGFMQKLISQHNEVHLLTVCGLGYHNSPKKTQRYIWEELNGFCTSKVAMNIYNLSINEHCIINDIQNIINFIQPTHIVTHSPFDNHFEHRIISNSVLVASRIKGKQSSLKSLWQTALPTTAQTYGQFGIFQPNVFIDISQFIDKKRNALKKYAKHGEIPYDNNDIRSIKSILNFNKQYGFLVGIKYAEAYQQLFSLQ